MIRYIRRQLEPYQADPRMRAVCRSAFLTNVVALGIVAAVLLPLMYVVRDDLVRVHTLQQILNYTFVSAFVLDVCVLCWLELEKRRLASRAIRTNDHN